MIDTQETLFLSIWYLGGIKWNFVICDTFVGVEGEQHFGRAAARPQIAQPAGIVLLPVVDMKRPVWKKDNSVPLLQKFVAQVQAVKTSLRNWIGSREF